MLEIFIITQIFEDSSSKQLRGFVSAGDSLLDELVGKLR